MGRVMTQIAPALIAIFALSMIVAVLVAMIVSWQKQRMQRESRDLDEMLFRKEDKE